jgi:hypothetical protein
MDHLEELLYHDDKLSQDDREKLWGLLQHVMSDPKSDMVPAKKKLFETPRPKSGDAQSGFFSIAFRNCSRAFAYEPSLRS